MLVLGYAELVVLGYSYMMGLWGLVWFNQN
jgi:hypothetical protein